MKMLVLLLVLSSASTFAEERGTELEGYSNIFYTTIDPAKVAESKMWAQAFKMCSEPVLLKPATITLVRNPHNTPAGIRARGRFECGY